MAEPAKREPTSSIPPSTHASKHIEKRGGYRGSPLRGLPPKRPEGPAAGVNPKPPASGSGGSGGSTSDGGSSASAGGSGSSQGNASSTGKNA